MAVQTKTLVKAALLLVAGSALSGCVYDVGLGFASDGYYDDGYGCDSYGGYDAYYTCDYGQGFGNIGYGGGWYDNYYYPGYGVFLFDSFGRRYPMREQYRRYWGERRHDYYREHRGRDRDGRRYDGRQRGSDYDSPNDWSGRRGDRARNRDDDRREGRSGADGPWRDGNGRGVNAAPVPNSGVIERGGRSRDQADGFGRPDRPGSRSSDAVTSAPVRMQQDAGAGPGPSARATPPPRPERPPPAPRQGREEGENVRDD